MPSRVRSRNVVLGTYVGSTYWRSRVPQTVAVSYAGVKAESCTDVVGNKAGVNPFHLLDTTRGPPFLLNGKEYMTVSPFALNRAYDNCPLFTQNAPAPAVWAPSLLELGNHAFSVQEQSNPSKPHVSLPTMIGELKDVPSLVKGFGDSLLKQARRSNLTWRWAVRPMMGDIRKLLDFMDAFDKKAAQIKKLSETGWLHTRVGLGSTSTTVALSNQTLESSLGVLVTASRQQTTTYRTWGTCRWKTTTLTSLPSVGDESGRLMLARRLTFGITSYETLAAAWELLPWSWFADWFTQTGTMISAMNNTLQLTAGTFCIMRTGTIRIDYHVLSKPSWVSCFSLPMPSQTTRKQRFVAFLAAPPVPSLTPLMSADKWSILTSLAAVRARAR